MWPKLSFALLSAERLISRSSGSNSNAREPLFTDAALCTPRFSGFRSTGVARAVGQQEPFDRLDTRRRLELAPPGTSPLCTDLCWRVLPQALTHNSATSLKVTASFFRARRLALPSVYNRMRLILCSYATSLNIY